MSYFESEAGWNMQSCTCELRREISSYLHETSQSRRAYNQTQEHTLSLLRQKLWICQAQSLVRRIINKCFTCRKGHAPMLHQQMASLPPCRVIAYEPPFTYVGADMFGPILVKQGRSTLKRWGCIFTCMCSRAIHLKVAPSLETDDFINVQRLFIARRGTPREILTDCGTNFRGADKELRHAMMKWMKIIYRRNYLKEGSPGYLTHPMHHTSREFGND